MKELKKGFLFIAEVWVGLATGMVLISYINNYGSERVSQG